MHVEIDDQHLAHCCRMLCANGLHSDSDIVIQAESLCFHCVCMVSGGSNDGKSVLHFSCNHRFHQFDETTDGQSSRGSTVTIYVRVGIEEMAVGIDGAVSPEAQEANKSEANE
jgi:hypothetical protein